MPTQSSVFKPTRKPIALAVLGLILAQHAAAQQTTPANTGTTSTAETAAQKSEPQKLDTVVVTSGSRIKRDAFSSPAPIQVIKNEDAALAGFTSTAQVLQSTSVTGGAGQINNAFGGYVTDGGPGANTVGLRGFAPTRSLVLLNGRRMSPSGTRGSVGAADLNTLPNAIVDRIEVLKDGASSIYGSDAVAGVINIITKKDLTGIRLDAQSTLTEHDGGNSHNFSIAGGMVNDHSRFLVSYNFNENSRMTLGQRDWTRCQTDGLRTSVNGVVGDWGSGDFIDPLTGKSKCYPITGTGSNGVTINTLGTSTAAGVGAAGSVGTSFNRWRPNAAVTTGLVGWEGVGGGSNNLNVRDTFDPRALNSTVMSPVRNHNLYAQGAFDVPALGGDAEAYWELLFNRRDSSQVGFRQLALDYAKGSPLIPANLQFSTFLAAGGSLITNGQATGVRAFIGAGNSYSSQSVDFTRAVAGLRGSFAAINWDYDVSLQHAESKGKYTYDGFRTDRLSQSMNVVASGSGFACANPASGCVATPALTPAVLAGQLPAAWLGFVYDNYTGVTKYKEDIVSASATGKLFKLPYGDVKGAVGAEFRRMSIDDTPSVDQQTTNIFNFTSSTPTRGSDNATDVFAEIEVPLLKDLPLAKDLTLNGSARRADYKSYGSGSTYKVGALWAPASWLSLRGTNGTSYRAPALFEQYVGATTGFLSQSNDPCNSPTPGSARAINCASEGLPATFSQTQSITSITKGGRDSGLSAETSKNASWGVILQPTLPTGWGDVSVAVDRFDVKVDNGVAQVGTANILSLCYDDPQFRTGGGGYCSLVTRNPTTNALSVNNSYINLSTDIARGYEYNIRYTNEVGIGKLRVNLSATEFHSQASRLLATDGLTESNGRVAVPRWSGALDVNYAVKGWTAYYGMEWVGKTSSYEYYQRRSTTPAQAAQYDPATSIYQMRTPNYFLHSLSLSYSDSVSKWKTTVGVRNLADKTPPTISQGFSNRVGNAPLYSGYDYLGRRLFLNVSKTF